MPKIGDRSNESKLGYSGRAACYYEACPECGKTRWVRIRQSGSLCNRCAAKKRAINYQGELSKRWKGGRIDRGDGYVFVVLNPANPYYSMASNRNRVLAHRLVMAMHLGRCLHPWEVVHHKNGNKGDNRLENLELVTNPQNLAYDRQDRELKVLTNRVGVLEKTVRLLLWHIQGLQQGNPVLSEGDEPSKCVETIYGASCDEQDDEIVQS
jgi:hypothetical protein